MANSALITLTRAIAGASLIVRGVAIPVRHEVARVPIKDDSVFCHRHPIGGCVGANAGTVRAEMVQRGVSLIPKATHSVVLGGRIKMFRFGSTNLFPNQSETISVGLRAGGKVSLFLQERHIL